MRGRGRVDKDMPPLVVEEEEEEGSVKVWKDSRAKVWAVKGEDKGWEEGMDHRHRRRCGAAKSSCQGGRRRPSLSSRCPQK